MAWLPILGFVGLIGGWLLARDINKEKDEKYGKGRYTPHVMVRVFCLTGGAIGIVLGFLWAALFIGAIEGRTWTRQSELQLHGLSNGLGVNAGIGFLYVRIDSANHYTYWYPITTDNNGEPIENGVSAYRSGVVTGDVLIREREDLTDGVLITLENKCDGGFVHIWKFCVESESTKHEFYVPVGTVAGTYELK